MFFRCKVCLQMYSFINTNDQLNVSGIGETDELEIAKIAEWVWISF